MAAWEVEAALERDGSRVVWRSNTLSGTESVTVDADNGTFTAFMAPDCMLPAGTRHYFRARQQSDTGEWSDWSFWHQEIITEGEPSGVETGWDFNGDGRSGLADVITLMLRIMRHPGDPLGDYDQDGDTGISDVVALVGDLVSGD